MITSRVFLALAILSNGSVEKCVLHVTADTDDATIATAAALLDTQLSGAPWIALPDLRPVAGPAADSLAREARDALAARAEQDIVEPLYVGRASRLAAEQLCLSTLGLPGSA